MSSDDNVVPGQTTPGANYTQLFESDQGADGFAGEYDLLSGTGTVAVDWTLRSSAWGVIGLAFIESAAAAVSNPPRRKPLRIFRR
jgi:hypothetical protein